MISCDIILSLSTLLDIISTAVFLQFRIGLLMKGAIRILRNSVISVCPFELKNLMIVFFLDELLDLEKLIRRPYNILNRANSDKYQRIGMHKM